MKLDDKYIAQALRRFMVMYAKPYKMNVHNPKVFLNTGEQLECYLFGSTTGERNDVIMFIHLESERPRIFGFGGREWKWRFVLIEGSSFFTLELVVFKDNRLTFKKVQEFSILPIN